MFLFTSILAAFYLNYWLCVTQTASNMAMEFFIKNLCLEIQQECIELQYDCHQNFMTYYVSFVFESL